MNLNNEMQELLETLRYVRKVMDSEDYSLNFDDLYERVSSVIAKYEGEKKR